MPSKASKFATEVHVTGGTPIADAMDEAPVCAETCTLVSKMDLGAFAAIERTQSRALGSAVQWQHQGSPL
jgi:hypothetical protein